jgi:hypothetical protein
MHLLSNLGGDFVARVGIYEAWQLPLTLLMLLSAVLIAKYPIGLFAKFENFAGKIADRPYLSAALIAGAATGARLALSPFLGIPQPIVADEASLMLQAKTYFGGHLANHVNLLPDFESVYVLLSPTYASMYPVLRSLPLFIGFCLGIGAWGGVLLSMVALTIAVYWMVREWINAKYAFIAALIVIIRYGLFSFWVNSYWGGAFTGLGGVLLLGGFKALRSRPNLLNGAMIGLGVFILMTTRPYEGMFYAAPFGAALVVQFIRSTTLQRKSLISPGLAAAVLVAAGFGLTLAHDEAVTGDWKVSPYLLYRQTVGQVPAFLVESRSPQRESQVRYAVTRADIFDDLAYNRRENWAGILSAESFRFRNYWNFYVGFALLIPFVVGIYALRGEATVLLAAAALGVGLSLGTFSFAHYAAPGFGFVMLAIMAGFRSLRQWTPWGYPFGLSLSRVLPLALVIGSVIPLSSAFTGWPTYTMLVNTHFSTPCCWLRPRSFHMNVADEVDRYEGGNLVIVDTGPKAPIQERLVSNDADIDNERTIWINEDAEFNRLEIERYPDRRVWRLGWLDDGAACLQLFQTGSSHADILPDIAPLASDQKQGWVPGSPDRCSRGLIHPPFVELK